jgi:hypothetical protein
MTNDQLERKCKEAMDRLELAKADLSYFRREFPGSDLVAIGEGEVERLCAEYRYAQDCHIAGKVLPDTRSTAKVRD